MKYLFVAVLFFYSYGCNQVNTENPVAADSNAPSETIEPQKLPNYNAEETESFAGEDGLYRFNAPKGLFKKMPNDEFFCDELNAKIKFTFKDTYPYDEEGFFSKNDLINKYKRKINTTYLLDKENWFVLSGTNSFNRIVYLKGFYEELLSMGGRDEGSPSWMWSKAGVLEIQYDEKYKSEFDQLIPIITKSFKCDFSVI